MLEKFPNRRKGVSAGIKIYSMFVHVCAIISFVSSHFGTQCFHSFLHTRNDDAAASSTDQKENANKQSNLVSVVFCEVIEYM